MEDKECHIHQEGEATGEARIMEVEGIYVHGLHESCPIAVRPYRVCKI